MPQCARCGQEIPATAGFCPACGQPASQPPSGSAVSTRPAAPALPLGEYLKRGWDLFKRYPGGFVGFFLLYFVMQIVLHLIPLVGSVASFAVGPALIMGNFIVGAKLLQNHTPKFSDFFLGFRFFIPLLLTAMMGGALTGIGLLLLIIPGLYLMVSYLFAASLVIDRRLDFWPALELSRRTVQPQLVQPLCLPAAVGAPQPGRRRALGTRSPGQRAPHRLRHHRRLCRPLRPAIRLFGGFSG